MARRQRFMAACMVGGPMLLFAGNALHPVNHKTDEAAWLAGIAAHRSQWYLAHLIIFLGIPLFVGAIVGLLRLVRGHGARWAETGAALAVFGLFATEAFVTVEGFVSWQMTTPGADRDQMVALLARFNDSTGTFIPVGLGTAMLAVGLAALAVGLLRANAVAARWAIAFLASRLIAIGALATGALAGEYQQAAIAAGDLVQLIALAGIAANLLPKASPHAGGGTALGDLAGGAA